MKKKYILIPVGCILVLIAIIISVAIALSTGYLQKLSYDHVSGTVYNGVQIMGDDGLFYLVKDGKKVSEGYSSLKSVNDFYGDIEKLVSEGKNVTLFDYYIARSVETSEYLLINSEGEEVVIAGDNYSLDTGNTSLPYLVFTNNVNGLKAAVSLSRLDSDISYKSGNELTLRTFKSLKAITVCENSAICAYLETEDVAEASQKSYFRADGIKITTGSEVEVITLYKENVPETGYVYFYNPLSNTITSHTGETVADNITTRYRTSHGDWQYALCYNEQSATYYVSVFSPMTSFTLSSENYDLEGLNSYDGCLTVKKANSPEITVIGISGNILGTYSSIIQSNSGIITAVTADGTYCYIDSDGEVLMTCSYSDMTAIPELSDEDCAVFTSAEYNAKNGASYYHFTRAGSNAYTLDVTDTGISRLPTQYPSFIITKATDSEARYRVLAPFSVIRTSSEYESVRLYDHNGVEWLLAESCARGVMEIVDPLTARAAMTLKCTDEDFARYAFNHADNIALATDPLDPDTAVHISIVKLEKYETDDVLSSAKYFAVYRTAANADTGYSAAGLRVLELGSDIRVSAPYDVYTAENYLAVHTASGSKVFSLDKAKELSNIASVPYHITNVISDSANTDTDYFVVTTDSGMMGLYDTDSRVVLSPYYSSIVSIEDGYVVVSMRGAYGVIRAKSNGSTKTVVDFLYSDILPTGDNGYLAVTGEGDTTVFSKGTEVLSSSIQSYDVIRAYLADDNGDITLSYQYVFSSDGKLYVHYSDQKVKLTFGSYRCDEPSDTQTALNRRATVIYYYSDSKLKSTQVIFATDSVTDILSELQGAADGALWYASESDTESVTAEYFKGRHIVRLYGKAA